MNNYRKLINLIKPEFQELYAITKNVGEENSFQLARVSLSGDVRTLNTLMNFRNVQNPMAVIKNGKNPFVSDVSSIYDKNIYNCLNIPKKIADFIYSTMNLNEKKNEMHLFLDNIFNSSGLAKTQKCSTSVKVKISNDYSTVDYVMIEHVYDVAFRQVPVSMINDVFTKNLPLFDKIKTYVKKKLIILDIHNDRIIIENLEDDKPVIEVHTFEDFIEKDVFMVNDIKKKGKEYLEKKIADIEAFTWSATDDN